MDRMTPQQRRHVMSRIRSTDTKPEMVVRRYLWQQGYRYRLHCRRLPGKPDIVLRRLHTVIQINGCFWHGHDCRGQRAVDTNGAYWHAKIARNRQRDLETGMALRNMGWTVVVIWECELAPAQRAATLTRLGETLRMMAIALHQPLPPKVAAEYSQQQPTPARAAYQYGDDTAPMAAEDDDTTYGKPKE